jgi:hypothetical protein
LLSWLSLSRGTKVTTSASLPKFNLVRIFKRKQLLQKKEILQPPQADKSGNLALFYL